MLTGRWLFKLNSVEHNCHGRPVSITIIECEPIKRSNMNHFKLFSAPLWAITLLCIIVSCSYAESTDWYNQLQTCLTQQNCHSQTTATLQKKCCLDCLTNIKFTHYHHIQQFLIKHPSLACAENKTTTDTSNTDQQQDSINKSLTQPKTGHAQPNQPQKGQYLFSLLIGGWWQSSHTQQNCNRDTLWLNANIDVFKANDNTLFSRQVDGSMLSEPLKRCPKTMYGGVRTTTGPTVRLIGKQDNQQYQIQLKFNDSSSFFYNSGASYNTGSLLNESGIVKETRGINVKGTLIHFKAPISLMKPDSQLNFNTAKSSSNALWWSGKVTIFIYQRKGALQKIP